MKQVAVYASQDRSNVLRRESLMYDSIALALGSVPDANVHRRVMPNITSLPGLREVRPQEKIKIVALGRAAHTVLADYNKRTLIADDDEDMLDEDVERLIWASINTSKVIALGSGAWRSVQMLPVSERRCYEVPPLRMLPAHDVLAAEVGSEVLVINHEYDETRAEQVAAALESGGHRVQRTGRCSDGEYGGDEGGWSARAPIHVHVGYHDSRATEIRLLDTWQSRRFAIVLLPRKRAEHLPAGTLMVDPEVNGFRCDTPSKVVAACAEIRSDAVLRKKMLHAGTATVAARARDWLSIAAELVS